MKTVVYSKDNCPACETLKAKLASEGVSFQEIKLGRDMTVEAFKEKHPFVRSVPFMEVIDDSV